MNVRVEHMLKKETVQLLRDPRMRAVIFVVPVFQLLVLGYAANLDVKHVPMVVVDEDGTSSSRELLRAFTAGDYFDLAASETSMKAAGKLLDRGDARVILHVGPDFEEDVLSGRGAQVQIIVDGTESLTTSVALSYAGAIVADFARKRLAERLPAGALSEPLVLKSRIWFNPNLESRPFYVPGVLVLLVTVITLMLTSMAVVREKETGTMEQIIVTPIRPWEFILGKTLPFAAVGMLDVVIVLCVAVFWFEVPLRGSVVLLFLGMGLYVLCTLGVGLLISTVSGTQQQAMMSTFFFFFPAMLLSGFMFPIANMPAAVQAVTYLNPMRYLLVIIRGIFLKGVGMEVLWPQFAALGVLGAGLMALSVRRFRKTLA